MLTISTWKPKRRQDDGLPHVNPETAREGRGRRDGRRGR
jgi:hypothetical protein